MSKKSKKPNPKEQTPGQLPAQRDLGIAMLGGIGVILTTILLVVSANQADLPYCGSGSSCDTVQNSRWSTFLGLPISAWGLALYVCITTAALTVSRTARRHRLVLFFATVGFCVSVYLNAISMWVIKATCIYCLTSLAILTAIYLLTWRTNTFQGLGGWRLGSSVFAAVAVGIMALHYAGVFDRSAGAEDPYLVELAEHLTSTDVKFYGAYWCPHCQEQKEVFGAAAARLPYIECSPNGQRGAPATACLSANVRNYPTWEISGRRLERTLNVRQIAKYSNFRAPPAHLTTD